MGTVWAEQEVTLTVDRSQQVGELEIRLHGCVWPISQPMDGIRPAPWVLFSDILQLRDVLPLLAAPKNW